MKIPFTLKLLIIHLNGLKKIKKIFDKKKLIVLKKMFQFLSKNLNLKTEKIKS